MPFDFDAHDKLLITSIEQEYKCRPNTKKVFFGSQKSSALKVLASQKKNKLIDKLMSSEAAERLVTNNKEKEYVAGKEHILDTPPTEDPHYIVFVKCQQDVHCWVWVKEGEFKPLGFE